MALTKTFPTQDSTGLPIVDTRLIDAGQVARDSSGNPRLGVLPAHGNALVTGAAGMSYNVAPFVAVGSRSGAGVDLVANDASASVATTAAPGANSRIDVIYWRPQFVLNGDAANLPVFGVVQGTAAASPTKPAIPAGAQELATATITSTTTQTSTAVIAQTFLYTAMTGGVVWLRNATEQAAWVPADGGLAYRVDLGQVVEYLSTAAGVAVSGWFPALGRTPVFQAIGSGSTQNVGVGGWILMTTALAAPTPNIGFTSWSSGVLTVAQAGLYRVHAAFENQANGILGAQVTKNSTTADSGVVLKRQQATNASLLRSVDAFRDVALAVGDALRFFTTDASGSFAGVPDQLLFGVQYLEPA